MYVWIRTLGDTQSTFAHRRREKGSFGAAPKLGCADENDVCPTSKARGLFSEQVILRSEALFWGVSPTQESIINSIRIPIGWKTPDVVNYVDC